MSVDSFDVSQMMLQLFDYAAESIMVLDAAGKILYANQITAAFGGVPVGELLGRVTWEVFPDAMSPDYEGHFRRCVREQTPVTFEYYHPPLDRWFEIRLYPSPDAVAQFSADMTVSKKAYELVRQSEEKYRTLFHSVDQGFCLCEIIWDAEGKAADYRFLEINPVFEEMTGLANAAGRTAKELVPNLEEFWFERYGAVARTGEAVRFQHGSLPMGRVFDVFSNSVGGDRIVILFTDITEKVRHEEEREALNERLRRSMQETHHRVKNNLQVIAALVDMQAGDMNIEAAAPLTRINQHIKSLSVIHDLLTQQVKTDADAEHLGSRAVLETLIPLLRATIGERQITTEIDDVTLTAQKAASLALLVSECVSNAVKHSNGGEIEVTLKREGDMAALEICDDGDGFPADFDPRKAANTGLQLIESTARWDLGGTLQFDNHGLGGGRVRVVFPLDVTA